MPHLRQRHALRLRQRGPAAPPGPGGQPPKDSASIVLAAERLEPELSAASDSEVASADGADGVVERSRQRFCMLNDLRTLSLKHRNKEGGPLEAG